MTILDNAPDGLRRVLSSTRRFYSKMNKALLISFNAVIHNDL